MMTSSEELQTYLKPRAKRLSFIFGVGHCCILKNVGINRPPVFSPSVNRLSILYYSAGQRDRGKNVRPPCQNPNTTPHLPGPRRGRRPRRRVFGGGGGRRPPTTRPNTGAPRKKVLKKFENLPALYIHDCVKLKTRLSRKRPCRVIRNLKLCSFCL